MSMPGPGWMKDPDHPDAERWWNGTVWTDLRRAANPPRQQPSAQPSDQAPSAAVVAPKPVSEMTFEEMANSPMDRSESLPAAFSVISVLLGFVSFLFNLFLLPGLAAIVLGICGVATAAANRGPGRSTKVWVIMGVVGIVAGAISTVLALIAFVNVLTSTI